LVDVLLDHISSAIEEKPMLFLIDNGFKLYLVEIIGVECSVKFDVPADRLHPIQTMASQHITIEDNVNI